MGRFFLCLAKNFEQDCWSLYIKKSRVKTRLNLFFEAFFTRLLSFLFFLQGRRLLCPKK